jgi:hypothetical protein
MVFETEEVIEVGLWFRRSATTDVAKVGGLRAIASGALAWPYESDLYAADVDILCGWLLGRSFEDIGEAAPTFPRGIFSSENAADRASDAAEQLARIAYPASWAWSGIRVLAGELGDSTPSWIAQAILAGTPRHKLAYSSCSRQACLETGQLRSRVWFRRRGERLAPKSHSSVTVRWVTSACDAGVQVRVVAGPGTGESSTI